MLSVQENVKVLSLHKEKSSLSKQQKIKEFSSLFEVVKGFH